MISVVIFHEYKTLTYRLSSIWDRVKKQYTVIAGLIQFAFQQVQIPDIGKSPSLHNRTSSMFYVLYYTKGLQHFHRFFVAYRPFYLTERFDSSVRRTLFHCSFVQYLCAIEEAKQCQLFCFLNSDFLTTILLYRLASHCLLPAVCLDTFSYDISP